MAARSFTPSEAADLSSELVTSDTVLADALSGAGDVALDTEFMRTDTFFPIPALYQIATTTDLALIDATAELSFDPLMDALSDADRTVVMHACSEDIEVLKTHLGIFPRSLVDTQLAHAFVKAEFSKSYAALVEDYLGVALEKDETRSDWLKRPLTTKQLAYARDDVLHLLPLWAAIRAELERLGRFEWFEAEMDRIGPNTALPEDYFRTMKGAWRLVPEALRTLKHLATWRELEARRRDVPRARTIRDEHLLTIATWQSISERDLAEVLPRGAVRRYGAALIETFDEAQADAEIPAAPEQPIKSREAAIVKELRGIASVVAEREGMAPELLARKRDVEAVFRSYRDQGTFPDWFGNWRHELIGEPFFTVLEGSK